MNSQFKPMKTILRYPFGIILLLAGCFSFVFITTQFIDKTRTITAGTSRTITADIKIIDDVTNMDKSAGRQTLQLKNTITTNSKTQSIIELQNTMAMRPDAMAVKIDPRVLELQNTMGMGPNLMAMKIDPGVLEPIQIDPGFQPMVDTNNMQNIEETKAFLAENSYKKRFSEKDNTNVNEIEFKHTDDKLSTFWKQKMTPKPIGQLWDAMQNKDRNVNKIIKTSASVTNGSLSLKETSKNKSMNTDKDTGINTYDELSTKTETLLECRHRHDDINKEQGRYWSSGLKNPCWHGNNGTLKCVPYFFVVGFPKCGTTDLYNRMSLHPGFIPPMFKEIHWVTRFRFFPLRRDINNNLVPSKVRGFDHGFGQYISVFSPLATKTEECNQTKGDNENKKYCMTQITGDFSPSTIWDADLYMDLPGNINQPFPKYIAADFVFKMNPCAKIIVMMRNPTERLYSDYLHFNIEKSPEDFNELVTTTIDMYENCFTHKSFKECVFDYTIERRGGARLRQGIYYIYILDWLERFPRDQFLFIRLEDYARDNRKELKTTFDFLEMDHINDRTLDTIAAEKPTNTRMGRDQDKHMPSMFNSTRQLLDKFYEPFNRKLALLLEDEKYVTWTS